MAESITETKLGITKGTPLEELVEANFTIETTVVGLYLAMALQAEREGYPEIVEALKSIAMEEAWHAARYAELNGKISASIEENLKKRMTGEKNSTKTRQEAALKAKEAGIREAQDLFEESGRDEGRHAATLEELLKRFF